MKTGISQFVERDFKTAFGGKFCVKGAILCYWIDKRALGAVRRCSPEWRVLKSAQCKMTTTSTTSYYIFQTEYDLILRLLFLIFISLYVGITGINQLLAVILERKAPQIQNDYFLLAALQNLEARHTQVNDKRLTFRNFNIYP